MQIFQRTLTLLLILASGPALAAAPAFCEGRLVARQIQQVMARGLPALSALSPEAGLPLRGYPIEKAAMVTRNEVALQTDLGLAVWSARDLQDWFALSPYLKKPEAARAELEKIGRTNGYCTPGLLPVLCRAMRDSRAARLDAVKQMHLAGPKAEVSDQELIALMVRIKELHQDRHLIHFAWGAEEGLWPDGLSLTQSHEIFRVLARETLIRHLRYTGWDGRERDGKDLPLETRLSLALAPMLTQLIALYDVYPLDLPEDFVLGHPFSGSILGIADLPVPTVTSLDPSIWVTLDLEKSPLRALDALVVMDYEALEEGDGRDLAIVAREITAMLEPVAQEFQREMGIRRKLVPQVRQEDDVLHVDLPGLSRLEQILFYYFAAERLAAAGSGAPPGEN